MDEQITCPICTEDLTNVNNLLGIEGINYHLHIHILQDCKQALRDIKEIGDYDGTLTIREMLYKTMKIASDVLDKPQYEARVKICKK